MFRPLEAIIRFLYQQ